MSDMNFQLVLEAVVKGQEALEKVLKTEEQIAKAAQAANAGQAGGAGKAEAAMKREAEAAQRAATAAKGLGAGATAAAAASTRQAEAAERVATAERRAADATKAHATAATAGARAVNAAARAQTGHKYRGLAADVLAAEAGKRAAQREAAAEAASRVTPNGYLLGASGAVMMGAAVGGTIAAAGAGAAYGLKQAISFEKAMADVKKKVELPAGAKWADIEGMINRTSVAVGMAREKTAGLTAEAAAAGIGFDDLGKFTMLAAKAASAWDMTAEDAASKLASLKTQTGMTIPELENLGNIINTLADNSNSKEAAIIAMLERSYASAKAAGVPIQTTLAMMTALNSGGMAPERAATFFNAFTSTLATAAQGGRGAKTAAEGFKALGLSAKAVQAGMKTDATKTMIDVLERVDKASDKAAVGVKIFGKQWWDEVARGGAALAEIIKNLKLISDPKNYAGSLDRNMATDLATTSKQLERFNALVSQIGAGMMRWALPPINDALEAAIKSYQRFQRMQARENSLIYSPTETGARFFREQAKARKPAGESLVAYESRLGLNPTGYKTMMTQIEGATPHIDVQQIDKAVADGVAKSNDLYQTLQKLNTTVTPNVNVGPAINALGALETKINAVATQLQNLNAARGRAMDTFGAPGAIRAPGASPPAALGKQSRVTAPRTGIVTAGGVRPARVAQGGTTVHYAPTLHVAGGDAKSFRQQLREHAHEVASLVRREDEARGRRAYGIA